MPTSKKITNVVICHNSSSSTVPWKKNDGAFTMDATRHDRSMDPEVCAGSHRGQRRTTYEGVLNAIVNTTSLEERFRSSSWVTAVMKTGQIGDREKMGPLSRKITTVCCQESPFRAVGLLGKMDLAAIENSSASVCTNALDASLTFCKSDNTSSDPKDKAPMPLR